MVAVQVTMSTALTNASSLSAQRQQRKEPTSPRKPCHNEESRAKSICTRSDCQDIALLFFPFATVIFSYHFGRARTPSLKNTVRARYSRPSPRCHTGHHPWTYISATKSDAYCRSTESWTGQSTPCNVGPKSYLQNVAQRGANVSHY